jgi:hypothetical protein
VPPNAIAKKIAITRPRMAGSVDNCIVLFVVVVMGLNGPMAPICILPMK